MKLKLRKAASKASDGEEREQDKDEDEEDDEDEGEGGGGGATSAALEALGKRMTAAVYPVENGTERWTRLGLLLRCVSASPAAASRAPAPIAKLFLAGGVTPGVLHQSAFSAHLRHSMWDELGGVSVTQRLRFQ